MISHSRSMLLLLSRASQPLQHPSPFSRVTIIYLPAIVTISSSMSFLQLLPASLMLSMCSAFCLLLSVFFICTCACSFFSYLMLPCHLDSSVTPSSCDAVAIAMCLHAATQKVKIQNVLTKISKIIKNKGPNMYKEYLPLCLSYIAHP